MTAFEIGGVRVQVSGSGALHTTPINLTVKEVDGSPSVVGVTVVKFPNGTLTDNGDGSVTYTAASGGTPTAISGANGSIDTESTFGVKATVAAGKEFQVDLGALVDAASLTIGRRNLGHLYVGTDGTVGLGGVDSNYVQIYGANNQAELVGGGNGSRGFQVLDDETLTVGELYSGAHMRINAAGDLLFVPTATTGKHGFFGSAGAVQATAASITDLAALKTYLTNLGLLS